MLREIKSMVQENSAMLKKLLKDNTDSEVPSSSTSVPNKEVKGQRTVEYYKQYGTLCNMVLVLK